jgi:hypothetical protein
MRSNVRLIDETTRHVVSKQRVDRVVPSKVSTTVSQSRIFKAYISARNGDMCKMHSFK